MPTRLNVILLHSSPLECALSRMGKFGYRPICPPYMLCGNAMDDVRRRSALRVCSNFVILDSSLYNCRMLKIVLDTNILVKACMGTRLPNRLLADCLRGHYQPLIGAALFSEYEDVMHRDTMFLGCRLNHAERDALLDAFLSVCRWTRVYYLWRPNLRDEADNHVLELAVAGGADYIITYNLRDFMQSEIMFPQLKICTPELFIKETS